MMMVCSVVRWGAQPVVLLLAGVSSASSFFLLLLDSLSVFLFLSLPLDGQRLFCVSLLRALYCWICDLHYYYCSCYYYGYYLLLLLFNKWLWCVLCVGGRLTIALLLTVCVCVLKVAVEMAVYGVIIKRIMLAMVC